MRPPCRRGLREHSSRSPHLLGNSIRPSRWGDGKGTASLVIFARQNPKSCGCMGRGPPWAALTPDRDAPVWLRL
jgi:hypothetical protein